VCPRISSTDLDVLICKIRESNSLTNREIRLSLDASLGSGYLLLVG
jgi:hypothetical protein